MLEGGENLSELAFNKGLRELNLAGNISVTRDPMYRERIKRIVPQLEVIDGLKVQNWESKEGEEQGYVDDDLQRTVEKELEFKQRKKDSDNRAMK